MIRILKHNVAIRTEAKGIGFEPGSGILEKIQASDNIAKNVLTSARIYFCHFVPFTTPLQLRQILFYLKKPIKD